MKTLFQRNRTLFNVLQVAILWLAVVLSAFEVAHVSYLCRDLYARLAVAESEGNRLKAEYGKSILELSTWGSMQRIEALATKELLMENPIASEIKIVGRFSQGEL